MENFVKLNRFVVFILNENKVDQTESIVVSLGPISPPVICGETILKPVVGTDALGGHCSSVYHAFAHHHICNPI